MVHERDKPWYADRLPIIKAHIRDRLRRLSARLGDADWLVGEFSAGDLMMVIILRRLDDTSILEDSGNLAAFVARGMARPAYRCAFDAQRAVFKAGQETGS